MTPVRFLAPVVAAAALLVAPPAAAYTVDHLPQKQRMAPAGIDFTPSVAGRDRPYVHDVVVTSRGVRIPESYWPSRRAGKRLHQGFVKFKVRFQVDHVVTRTGRAASWSAFDGDGYRVDTDREYRDARGRLRWSDGSPRGYDGAGYWRDLGYRVVYGPWAAWTYDETVTTRCRYVTRIRFVDR